MHVFNFDQTTNYAGESAHVCLNQGNTFTCPTSTATCDEEKCPLQGSPVATKIGVEPTRVKIEVSGVQFLISEKKLDRWPRTLLGNPDDRLKYKDCTRNMYIFDSNAFKT